MIDNERALVVLLPRVRGCHRLSAAQALLYGLFEVVGWAYEGASVIRFVSAYTHWRSFLSP